MRRNTIVCNIQPQLPTTAIHNDDPNEASHRSIAVLNDRIEAYRRSLAIHGRDQDLQLIASVYHRFVDQLRRQQQQQQTTIYRGW